VNIEVCETKGRYVLGIAGRCGVERYRKERTKENQNYLDVNKLQVWRELIRLVFDRWLCMRRNGLRSPLWAGSQFKLIPGASNSRGRRLQPLHLGSHTSLRCSNDKICQLRVRHSSGAGNQMSEISCASYGEASWFPRELDLPSVFC
jgi:hypothetical protein